MRVKKLESNIKKDPGIKSYIHPCLTVLGYTMVLEVAHDKVPTDEVPSADLLDPGALAPLPNPSSTAVSYQIVKYCIILPNLSSIAGSQGPLF